MTDTAEPYVDAGHAVSNSTLALIPGEAPQVTDSVNYERIRQARTTFRRRLFTHRSP